MISQCINLPTSSNLRNFVSNRCMLTSRSEPPSHREANNLCAKNKPSRIIFNSHTIKNIHHDRI